MQESILDRVLAGTEEAESPKQFYYWSTLATIAAVLKRNVWVDRHYFKIYPNIYVLLVARSGLRKGNPIALASELVKAVGNTRVIEGRTSIQAMITDLCKAHHNGTKTYTDGCALISSGEFSISLIEDKQAMTILTDLYDSQYLTEWTNRTKAGGAEKLKEVGVTLLGASNEPLLKEVITAREKYGGFMGRTFLVYADKKNTINALIDKPQNPLNRDILIKELTEISNLKGEIVWSNQAALLFKSWYAEIASSTRESEDTTGLVERIDSHVLKVAMLIHIARSRDLILEESDIQESIAACSPLLGEEDRVSVSRSKEGDTSERLKLVLGFILARGKISRIIVLQRLHRDGITAEELNRLVDTLVEAKLIKSTMEGKIVYYEPTREALQIYSNFGKT